MAETTATNSFSSLPMPRLIGMLLGVATSIAIGVGVLYWASAPAYTTLYTGLDAGDAADVIGTLQAAAIPYRLDSTGGVLRVESGRLQEAHFKLASRGSPAGSGINMHPYSRGRIPGIRPFVETAGYHQLLEFELARTIGGMRNVSSARVHLADPAQSTMAGAPGQPGASVVLNLKSGRDLEPVQVNAIVHLVASSISHMSADQVTVIDQDGRLLSSDNSDGSMSITARHYEYRRQLEQDYVRRIEHLLEAIVGLGNVRATVNADIDFADANLTGGRPSTHGTGSGVKLGKDTGRVERNVDVIKRLSVMVLVDDRVVGQGRKRQRTPLPGEELQRLTTLVQQTIGFDRQRGDVVNVMNASFTAGDEEQDLSISSLLEQSWLQNLGKQLLAGIIIFILLLKVVLPALRHLIEHTPTAQILPATSKGSDRSETAHTPAHLQSVPGPLPGDHDQKMDFARTLVRQDARRVANVVKDWIGSEG